MVAKQEHVSIAKDIQCTCKIQVYTIFMLCLSILGLVIFIILKSRKQKLFIGQLKTMLFISDTQYYVPIQLCRIAGSIFKITGILTPENVKLKKKIYFVI